jgi:hypothetical protein
MQQYLPQQEIQRRGLSVEAPSSANSDTLKIATVAQQIMTELSEAVSEKAKIMLITKMLLSLMKRNRCYSSEAAQNHSILMQIAFGGGAKSSVNSCKTYIWM